ncbi:MAG: ORF6N domain-containing protein [Flavobacteriales bacterium]
MEINLDVSSAELEHRIFSVRGTQVMLDSDLAVLYGVSTKRLNEQVKRNMDRFPEDFMFQLNKEEWENLRSQMRLINLRSQNATFQSGQNIARKYRPFPGA